MDVWGSDDEGVSQYADVQRAHIKQGYLDGITKAQEHSLQEGFDAGYPLGASLGMEVGRLLAGSRASKDALNITKILDKKYFDDQLDLVEPHPVIAELKAEPKQ